MTTWHKTFWYMPDDYGVQTIIPYTEAQFEADKKACHELGYEFLIDRDDMLLVTINSALGVVTRSGARRNRIYLLYMKEGVIGVTS